MVETDPEYMLKVRATVSGDERLDELCSILRGLLYSNGNSNGQATKNKEFKRGVVIEFGTSPKARDFIESADFFLKKPIRDRVKLELIG